MNSKRMFIFSIVFLALNLAFIPLLSLYGLRVCPVLQPVGFLRGCGYTSVFITLVGLSNLVLIFWAQKKFAFHQLSRARISMISFAIYLIATVFALLVLQSTLGTNHFTDLGRAPEILFLASLLLGTTQSYGLSWALPENSFPKKKLTQFQFLWFSHVFRSLLPVLITLVICIHFLFSQSVSFNEGRVPSGYTQDSLIEHTTLLIGILCAWLAVTLTFFFLNERTSSAKVRDHLNQIKQDNYSFQSQHGESFGLWGFILEILNDFSSSLSEKKDLEADIIEKSKFVILGESVGNLAHEIRNPMAIIKGHAERIRRSALKAGVPMEDVIASADKIDSMIERQNKIIEGVRSMTHSSHESEFQKVVLGDLLKVVQDMTSDKVMENKVNLTVNGLDSKTEILGQQTQLSQVLINLISNSIDAISSQSEKWVRLDSKLDSNKLILNIVDSGHGIPIEIASQLFKKNLTTKSLSKGTGLGLKLCKRIIESHGGQIYIVSGEANTTFRIELPVKS